MVTNPQFFLANWKLWHLGLPESPTTVIFTGGAYYFDRAGWDGSETQLQYTSTGENLMDELGRVLQSFGPVALPYP